MDPSVRVKTYQLQADNGEKGMNQQGLHQVPWKWSGPVLVGLGLGLAAIHAAGAGSATAASSASKPKLSYISIKLCRLCHSAKSTGNQYAQWKKSRHAKAFAVLGTSKAKKIAAEKGIQDPRKDKRCLKCHVTASQSPALSKKIKPEDGVQCESCHGPGERYTKAMLSRLGRKVYLQRGLVIPDKKICLRCHNKESPTFPGNFDFEKMRKKVLHPMPRKKQRR